jgi:ParB family chromosome partitioning protein
MSRIQQFQQLPIAVIEPDPSRARRDLDAPALHLLASSVRQRGILQPVLVRPRPEGRYQLIAGERRWRAAQIAGLQQLPALVSPYDDAASLEAALIDNLARHNLNVVEDARACATLVKEFGLTHRDVGRRVKRATSGVGNLVRILHLSEEILGYMERGELGSSHALALLAARDPGARGELARGAIKEGWTADAIKDRATDANKDLTAVDCEPPPPREPKRQNRGQYLDVAVVPIAQAWGDVLGTEVTVVSSAYGRVRLEIRFNSAEASLAAAGRLAAAVSRGSTDLEQ